MCTPCNTCFLEPTRVHNTNGIWIGSAVFAGLTVVIETDRSIDRLTHHATPSVTTGRIYVVLRYGLKVRKLLCRLAQQMRTIVIFLPFLLSSSFLVHGQVTIIFVVSVCLSVCLFVCLFVCSEFFSAVFDPISIKLGHMLYVWVQLCPLEYRGCMTPGGWVTPKNLYFQGF